MGLNFTTIDFETANETRASACAVGLTTVRHGRVIKTRSWYIQPPGGTRFTNTHIHGITESHVRNAPTWSETVAIIDEISDGTTLVAYNSPFDKGVHKAACTVSGVDHPGHVWRDARVLAKTHLSLENYRLPHVSRHLGLPAFDHHDPGEDAEACAQVTLRLASMAAIDDFGLLWPVTAVSTGTGYRRYTPPPPASVTADPLHPLYGVSVTFTGELVTLSRPEAQAAVAALGAAVTAGPTRKTDVVVVGGFDPSTLRAGSTVSSKLRRAVELKEAGRRIELISEADLIALIAYEPDR